MGVKKKLTLSNTSIVVDLPEWAKVKLSGMPRYFDSNSMKMKAVIEFARENFIRETGGPFAAGIFESESGKLVSMGVNRVVYANCSTAHAEVVAISIAQQILETYDLGNDSLPAHQLVVNWLPCAMCFGATLWSGVRSVVIAGSGPELENITGFDEGPHHPDWRRELSKRGIELIENVMRAEAIEVFNEFSRADKLVYNPRQGEY